MPKGGTRTGAGRTPLSPEKKKKDYKIYLNEEQYEIINNCGDGNSFSAKVMSLVNAGIKRRNEKIYNYKFIDLFAGVGGFHLAFEKWGNECVFASEIEPHCQKVYQRNFGMLPAGDITKIDAKDIPNFDILCAGFPCQPFSYAGRLEGFEDKTRGTLFFDILRILKEKKPKMFLLENVKGLKSHQKGQTLNTIISCLEDVGYTVYWKVIDSHDFGVPQKRERWYCVGFDKKISFDFPKGTNNKTTLRDIVDVDLDDKKLKLSDFEMERIKHHFESSDIRVKHDNSKYAPNTKKGKYGVYSYLKPDNTLRFHIGDVAKTQIQEAYYCSLDSVAPAIIVAREPKLWDLGRRLSVDECRKLQGFPDWFVLDESEIQAKKQMGNSVAVPVVEAIAKSMLDAYEKNN
jgi:DNA (cytosine-5)-methyltransferase 1